MLESSVYSFSSDEEVEEIIVEFEFKFRIAAEGSVFRILVAIMTECLINVNLDNFDFYRIRTMHNRQDMIDVHRFKL